jgi:branched-chain amino acid transport system permease protein
VLAYIIAGLALGGLYSLAAAGLVTTYVSTGVLNFAFAAEAYFVGRFYYYLNSQHGWSTWQAGLLSIVVLSPVLGLVLWALLFRLLRLASQLTKIVATVGLSVALPALAALIFGTTATLVTPGLAPLPVQVFNVLGTTLTLDQLIAYVASAVILLGGMFVLLRTTAGLRVRAVVDSEAMTALSGVNPSVVSAGVWTVTTFIAGLVGVLAAPLIGLDSGNYILLMVSAFAAVVAAQLRSLPIAALTGIAIGVVGAIGQWLLPPSDPLVANIIPSVPFAFILIFLLYHSVRPGHTREAERLGGPLDSAIVVKGTAEVASAPAAQAADRRQSGGLRDYLTYRQIGPLILVGVLALSVTQLSSLWAQLVALAAIYAVTFMSFTLVTGGGGMIWVCQISFAGVGAVTTAQLAYVHHWPVLAALAVGALIAGAMGLALGALTIRLGDIYVALSTLAFGLLLDNLVFQRAVFYNQGSGVTTPRPGFAASASSFDYFALVVMAIAALIIANINRSSIGLALAAVRSSEAASRTISLSTVKMKLFVATLGAVMAGLGGGLLAAYQGVALPQAYEVIGGLVWLAVVVTLGLRSPTAAIVAGVVFAYVPELFASYLPASVAAVPTVLFGVGAIMIARHPRGMLAMHARQLDNALAVIVARVRAAGPAAAIKVRGE